MTNRAIIQGTVIR